MRRLISVALLLPVVAALRAQDPAAAAWAALPPYRPEGPVRGTIRLWGHGSTKIDFMRRLVDRWIAGFHRYEPGVKFEYRMYGTASAVGALYTGAGDLALMGEEVFPFEQAAYERALPYPPASVEIATGSLDVRNFDFAQMFFVHRGNPIRSLSLQQLDAIWGTERRLGAPRAIRTWGDLGLGGAWADRPIHLYGWSFDNDFWIYLGQAMLGGSHRLNPTIRGYAHIYRPDGTIYDAGQQILDALAKDPDGLAVSNIRYANPAVRALAISARPGGPAYQADAAHLISRRYPLTRILPAVFNQPPGEPVEPAVKEFLRYILSREGQRDIADDGEYLPLDPRAARAGLARLDRIDTATLRICGDDRMRRVVRLWEEGYRRSHPGAAFENDLRGTGTGMAGLYTGTADIALLGRSIEPVETMAFAWVYRHPPLGVPVARGSADVPGKSPALAIIVNAANPISRMTLAQLDGIFDWERRRGGPDAGTWGALGLGGAWAGRPVHAMIRDVDSGTAAFFHERVMLGGLKWNWARVTEWSDGRASDGRRIDADERMAQAVAADPDAIAVGDAAFVPSGTKVLAIAAADGGPGLAPTRAAVASGRYPLARRVWAFVNRAPGKPVDPKVADFLDYVLSPAGQEAVRREGDFLALDPAQRVGAAARLR